MRNRRQPWFQDDCKVALIEGVWLDALPVSDVTWLRAIYSPRQEWTNEQFEAVRLQIQQMWMSQMSRMDVK